jgi:TetR/AcrR family transcriptional repressor of nem operon
MTAALATAEAPMRERILDLAEEMLLSRGYDGFSYQDIAEAVGIRKASIHHHFAAKEDLARAIVERARIRLAEIRGAVTEDGPRVRRLLDGYFRFFERLAEQGNKLCLGGRLAADQAVLPDAVRAPHRAFLADNEAWLNALARAGQKTGIFKRDQAPADQALMVRASVQGAVQLAVAQGDAEPYRRVVRQLKQQILA